MQCDTINSTTVDANKWGVLLASDAQNMLYKKTVSEVPAGAVFIPVVARNLHMMSYTNQGSHQRVKFEKLTYDILQAIINLAVGLASTHVCSCGPSTHLNV